MSNFKIGQNVVCISNDNCHDLLIKNKVYTICNINRKCLDLKDTNVPWSQYRFEDFDEWTAKQPKPIEKEIMKKETPHIHAEFIKAWADGEQVQFYSCDNWVNVDRPCWDKRTQYRIKPETVYPETTLAPEELFEFWTETDLSVQDTMVFVANSAIKHFIKSGDMQKYLDNKND